MSVDYGLKRESFAEAVRLLEGSTSAAALRQAALELRRCLEAFVYEKLWAYRDRLPPAVTRKWQPPQAFKALLQMEPGAAGSRRIRMAVEQEEGVAAKGPYRELGVDHRPDPKWLTKHYNKLGSCLHVVSPFVPIASNDAQETRTYLLSILENVRPWISRSLTSTLDTTVSLECFYCGNLITASVSGVRKNQGMTCLDADCAAKYVLSGEEDGQLIFHPDVPKLTCIACKKDFNFPQAKVVDRAAVNCPACGAGHLIHGPIFEVELRPASGETANPPGPPESP